MQKRSSKPKHDVSEVAASIVPEDKAPEEKNPAAVALGRLGGLKGGPARAAKLSAKQRGDIAKRAAQARWGNDDDNG
jgi:hypothetical protein